MNKHGGMYNLYDKQKVLPHVRGGIKRASTAVRDQLGRLMPVDIEAWDDWKLDPKHGHEGGAARAASAPRDQKGRFTS